MNNVNFEQTTVYLGFGSNMGNRQDNVNKAMAFLSQRLRIGKVSSLYDTEPVDTGVQPRFLNLVCEVFTRLAPEELLTLVQGIEQKLGRAANTHNQSRPIDIDILLYGDQVIKSPKLTIPHPRMIKRAFVLVPLAEITPELTHPVAKKTIAELTKAVTGKQDVLKLEKANREK